MYRIINQKSGNRKIVDKTLGILAAIFAAVFVLMLLATAFIPSLYRFKETLNESVFVVFAIEMGIIVIAVLRYIFFREKGTVFTGGNLVLSEDSITADGQDYPLSELKKIRFVGNDIKGDFRGFVTKGTDNTLMITQKDGTETSWKFEQTENHQLKNDKIILQKYCDAGLLSESNFGNILNNTNYY